MFWVNFETQKLSSFQSFYLDYGFPPTFYSSKVMIWKQFSSRVMIYILTLPLFINEMGLVCKVKPRDFDFNYSRCYHSLNLRAFCYYITDKFHLRLRNYRSPPHPHTNWNSITMLSVFSFISFIINILQKDLNSIHKEQYKLISCYNMK